MQFPKPNAAFSAAPTGPDRPPLAPARGAFYSNSGFLESPRACPRASVFVRPAAGRMPQQAPSAIAGRSQKTLPRTETR